MASDAVSVQVGLPTLTATQIDPTATQAKLCAEFGSDGSGNPLLCDLVLEGGATHGAALLGAVQELIDRGYTIHRVAGTSIGALVGAAIVGGFWQQAWDAMLDGTLRRMVLVPSWSPWHVMTDLLRIDGQPRGGSLVEGDDLQSWVDLGVIEGAPNRSFMPEGSDPATWRSLRMPGDDSPVPISRRYRLQVVSTDPRRRVRVVLPRDYGPVYGRAPDDEPIASAVYASMAIPGLLEPARIADQPLVDGAVVTNFPIDLFDRPEGDPPRFPTFGIKLGSRASQNGPYLTGLLVAAVQGRNREASMRIDVLDRTVSVPVTGSPMNLWRSMERNLELADEGAAQMQAFLGGRDRIRPGKRGLPEPRGYDQPELRSLNRPRSDGGEFSFALHQENRCRVVYGLDGAPCPATGHRHTDRGAEPVEDPS